MGLDSVDNLRSIFFEHIGYRFKSIHLGVFKRSLNNEENDIVRRGFSGELVFSDDFG